MRILVTGCAGFIGWKVSQFLLDDNKEVVGVDNLNHAYDVRLKEWRLDQLQGRSGFHFHCLDIREREALRELWERNDSFDAVINLAARAGVRRSVENPWIYFETNVTGTLNLLNLCRDFGVEKFVLASTSSLYGAGNPLPFSEDADTDRPLSPYAASKKGAEALCHTYHYLYDIDVTVFRYFTVYGPAGRPGMSVFRFIQWISEGKKLMIYGDGQQSRDFTFVEDIARGTIAGLKPVGYEVVNLGSDEPIVLMEAVRLIEDFLGKKARIDYRPRHRADVLATWADIRKAQELFCWQPGIGFIDGIKRSIDWYRANREWAKAIKTY